jgi:UDP-glucuronate 4-epimerase
MSTEHYLVTGAAGFIGSHTCAALSRAGHRITGIDNLNAYYDVTLKEDRLRNLAGLPGFEFKRLDFTDRSATAELFRTSGFTRVIHLGAQAGVRHSLTHPHDYADSNLVGFLNILEGCRNARVAHLTYASSSSVYGLNTRMPFSVHQSVDHPVSLYAATKKANELMAHTYSHLYNLPTTGLRFFTVYGPWGRPDMAYFSFTKKILEGRPIEVFNEGRMQRDFTYIDDVVEGVVRVAAQTPTGNSAWDGARPDLATSSAPYRIFNIGNNQPVELIRFIRAIETATGKQAVLDMKPMQPGDVPATAADVSDLMDAVGFRPATTIEDGIRRFVDWYCSRYQPA